MTTDISICSSSIVTVDIPIGQIHPNDFNPNQMTEEEFAALVNEVRRLGHPPKPIVVRPADSGFSVIDGEHALRAAQEIGLKDVPCEIRQVNNYEAMMETFKRNQHGRHDPLREARMFAAMKASLEPKMSNYTLAADLGIAEGTVRNRLKYIEASELRSHHAGEDRSREVGKLSQRQVDHYLCLPPEVRNIWLDAGGAMSALERLDRNGNLGRFLDVFGWIIEADLVSMLVPDGLGFTTSTDRALDLCEWALARGGIAAWKPYLLPVATHGFPPEVLEELPFRLQGATIEQVIPIDAWQAMLGKCPETDHNNADRIAQLCLLRDQYLGEAGIDRNGLAYGFHADRLTAVLAGPNFICDADYLSLSEKWILTTHNYHRAPELELEAKRLTCEAFRARRAAASPEGTTAQPAEDSVADVLASMIAELEHQARAARDREVYSDPNRIRLAVKARLLEAVGDDAAPLPVGLVAARLEMLLELLEAPELSLLGALVLGEPKASAVHRWVEALQGGLAD